MITNKYKKKKTFSVRKVKTRRKTSHFFLYYYWFVYNNRHSFRPDKATISMLLRLLRLFNFVKWFQALLYIFLDNNVKSMLPLAMCSTNDNSLPKVFNPSQQKSKKKKWMLIHSIQFGLKSCFMNFFVQDNISTLHLARQWRGENFVYFIQF